MLSVRRHLPRLFCGSLVALAGCAALPRPASYASPEVAEHELHCARATMGAQSPYRMPLAAPVSDPEQVGWLEALPPEARHTARAGGLEPLLVALLRARADASADESAAQRALRLQQELTLRLLALETQVASLAFETSCTRQRITGLLAALDRREGDRQLSLAAASLVVGAVSGTLAGVWDMTARSATDVPAYIAISGGVATAALGASALFQPARWVKLEHAHNLLRPMAAGSDPEHLYPSFVFRMLTVQYDGELTTVRAVLLQDFGEQLLRFDPLGRAQVEATLFGAGGLYDRGLLELREALLHALESAVQGVARDLELLNRTLVRLLPA